MNATAQNQIEILSKWLCRVKAEKHMLSKQKKSNKNCINCVIYKIESTKLSPTKSEIRLATGKLPRINT